MTTIGVPRANQARGTRSLSSKLPVAMLIAAALVIGVGTVTNQRSATADAVDAAIAAPFIDVGIGSIDEAVAFWQRRVDQDPSDYLSRTRLATTIMAKARETGVLSLYPKAEAVLHDALALNPVDQGALLALAAVRAANHDFSGSTALAGQVLARDPSSLAALVAIADNAFELGDYDAARTKLAALRTQMPEGGAADSRLARQAAIEGRIDDAIAYAAAATTASSELDLRPSEAAFYRFQLAHFLYQGGRVDDAAAALDAALAVDPDHTASLELRAEVLVSQGQLEQAVVAYLDLVDRTPAADLHGALAKVYRALGRDVEADKQVEIGRAIGHEALGIYPAERRHLAGFFADHEPATALEAALADFDSRHDIGAYDTLAWAYFRTGQAEQAAKYIDGALSQGTQDARLLYHAGMIEAAVGHDDEAIELLSDALAINPSFDLVDAPLARAELARLWTRR